MSAFFYLKGGKYYEVLIKAEKTNSIGASAGAFVYLRRIFEEIVEEEHIKSNSSHSSLFSNQNPTQIIKVFLSHLFTTIAIDNIALIIIPLHLQDYQSLPDFKTFKPY